VKTLLNSVISTPNTRFMTADLKDFYFGTPLEQYEYMCIPVSVIPAYIMTEYKLVPLVHHDHVYVKIRMPDELPTIASLPSLPHMVTSLCLSHLDFGNTPTLILSLLLLSMTSASNTPTKPMLSTSCKHCNSCIP
jgi:hypothetical protein